ncbi:hypothetical protein APHAL10511_004747 [Amanita phalloides]|nr:hypothetical protein APHAL10511_004747 [Amanita phalloides]
MNASASGLIQITHIHFLTILYPSRLEGRLILTLLVPLAVLSAVMQLIPIEGIESNRQSVLVASAVHNVCSATLSLLFTTALFLWGFLVNRRQAWRTDGGTAAFGTAALTLAVFSTTLNFIYVDRQVEYVWLPSLLWTVILWQSFLGWWWWVGAGSGSGLLYGSESIEIEERLKMQENREMKKRETKERRREAGMRARKVFKNMTGAFGRSNDNDSDKNTVTNVSSTTTAIDGPISQSSQNDRRRYRRDQRSPAGNGHETEFINVEPETVFSASSVTGTPTSQDSKPRYIPDFLFRWYASLRHAHQAAARAQDAERVERIRGLGRNHPIRMGGWGFGGFGWRAAREWCAEAEINGDAWKRHSLRRQGDEFEMHDNSRPLRSTLEGMSSEETLSSRIEPTGSTALPKDSADQPPSDQTFPPSVPPPTHHGSIWWWGPLRRWRLQDSTTY